MTDKQQKLIDILTEMFQLGQSDLDFGIYRIMNSKADEIKTFLEKELIGSIKEAFSTSNSNYLQAELNKAIASAKSLGISPETSPKVQELRAKLLDISDTVALENEIYSHLATFFSRYYKDGDFISLRRYKKDTYAIPYEGEEVKLYWANSDQYYIKTSEYFKDYTFKVGDKTIHFKLIDADTKSDNNKATSDKERRFIIYKEKPLEEIDGELFIYFTYKAVGKIKQEKLNEEAFEIVMRDKRYDEFKSLLTTPAPTEKNKNRTLLEKHLKSYTSRNSFDYFIHKDLGGFLNRELDFYIKNEMLYIDDIEEASTAKIEQSLQKIKTFKAIAKKIIAFLTQLEEFQKSLWLKKKFIIETNYCITLDKIDEKYYKEIVTNEAQLKEWEKLYDVKIESIDDLKAEPYLVLDTKFFDTDFKNRILAEFNNLDEEIDGVLINSENFGALNLLQERYRKQIKTIYIDPPYNTGNDGFLYHDSYKHSSWMSFMYDRLTLGRELMSDDGVIFSSIDDGEVANLDYLLNNVFLLKNFIAKIVWQKRTAPDMRTTFSDAQEYILLYGKTDKAALSFNKLPLTDEQKKRYKNPDNDPRGPWVSSDFTARGTRPNQLYGIKTPSGKIYYPPEGKCWQNTEEGFLKQLSEGRFYFGKNGNSVPRRKNYLSETNGKIPWSWWTNKEVGHSQEGKVEVNNIFGKYEAFSTPKTVRLLNRICTISTKKDATVIDYFAGSGTTGHAVINLNRQDSGKRRYILVEMGEYFDTVTKPRIQKVIYTDNWKNGKPQDKKGISQMFKYFKLESYEDTLNNLEFKRTQTQQSLLESNPKLKEDYLLNYMLDYESSSSKLNIDNFSKPYNYKLKVSTGSVGETKERAIDLIETFNYLIGLRVKTRRKLEDYLVIEGENLKEERILIIWREGNDNEALNSFFSKIKTEEFDTIYINGDNNLANLKRDEDHFRVKLIEEAFKNKMFGE